MKVIKRAIARMDSRTATAILLAASLLFTVHLNAQTICQTTWTVDADFSQGNLINVNYNAPNSDQLQLNTVTAPPPFVYIACSNRGTVVRIDVNTGAILGEYWSSPSGMGKNPSRTTVDQFGNCWVANRNEGGLSGGMPKGSVTRIALVIGGTRCNADGTPNPAGQYLKPPFLYSTAVDRDNDGLIKTSTGLGNVLPWTNSGSADTHGGVSTADDECIITYTRVIGTGTRTIAVDANNDVWVGGLSNRGHEKLDGNTGLPVPGTQFYASCGGYGGLVDGNGILWSARGGSGLLRYDPVAMTSSCLGGNFGDYGIGIDPNTGEIWHSNLYNNRIAKLSPAGALLGAYNHGNYYAQGVAVDNAGNVWVAHSLLGPQTTVGHLRTDGTFVGNVVLPGGAGPTGVAVDANGKVWVACYNSHNVMRIDPNAGAIGGGGYNIGAVDLTVSLASAGWPVAAPYNYSDMTGAVSLGATQWQGSWTVIYNSGEAGTTYGKISWTDYTPGSTQVIVEARAAASQVALAGETFVAFNNGQQYCGAATALTGQYVELRVRLIGDPGATPVPLSPILYDITLEPCDVTPPVLTLEPNGSMWPPDHKYRTFTVGDMVATVYDNCSSLTEADVVIYSAYSDEPENIHPDGDDGNTVDDIAFGSGCSSVDLRSERIGTGGNGRVYGVSLGVSDESGNTTFQTFYVSVQHDESGLPAVNDGAGAGYTANCMIAPKFAGHVAVRADGFILEQNYPNPFNPITQITWVQPMDETITLSVYDMFGRHIRTLAEGSHNAGAHHVIFDASGLASGTYVYVLHAGRVTLQDIMILQK